MIVIGEAPQSLREFGIATSRASRVLAVVQAIVADHWPMSALLRKRTNRQVSRSVRFVPIATERSAAKSHCLFDHLVGAAEQRKWDYRYIPDLDRIRCGRTSPRRRLLQLAGLVIVTNRAREIPPPRRVIHPPASWIERSETKKG